MNSRVLDNKSVFRLPNTISAKLLEQAMERSFRDLTELINQRTNVIEFPTKQEKYEPEWAW